MQTTRKYPRTLTEAFGPHTSRYIQSEPEPLHPHDVIVLIACGLALVALFVMFVLEWMPG